MLAAAVAGLGIAILPETYVLEELKKQHLVELFVPGLVLKNNMYAIWHRDKYLSKPLKAFIETCSALR
ncbi:MAG: LysR substrate-binding domain-containing protein [Emergencia timonensis]